MLAAADGGRGHPAEECVIPRATLAEIGVEVDGPTRHGGLLAPGGQSGIPGGFGNLEPASGLPDGLQSLRYRVASPGASTAGPETPRIPPLLDGEDPPCFRPPPPISSPLPPIATGSTTTWPSSSARPGEATPPIPHIAPLYARLAEFVLRGGKRLRPRLCLASYRITTGRFDPPPRPVALAAASLEIFHAFMLGPRRPHRRQRHPPGPARPSTRPSGPTTRESAATASEPPTSA